ncbi:MAG: ATP-binding cassette domain-containing protein, partial [Deltaproteobacteria bacterium]|nr:ATP-binding cassette domain-containing protein [Deltaproteobacteria bacterium]
LYSDLEVTAYLSYMATLRNLPREKTTRRLRDVIEIAGLGGVVGRPIGQLSKGYRQRVGLAQALIHDPPILILDEPTSGLDPNQIVEIRKLIRDLGRERTIILSTHILQEVEATCTRALIISRGKLVAQGSIDELLQGGSTNGLYTVSMHGEKDCLEAAIHKLDGAAGVTLSELRRETASLEDVFRELTQ